MGTAIREGSYVSAKRASSRLENRSTDTSGFREIDQLEGAAPDVGRTLHQLDRALTAQGVNRRPDANAETSENRLASAGQESSAQAVEGAVIDRILSGHKELFMDLIRPHQRTVYATVFSLLANKEDAEDVAQDALLKALARLNQFRKESTFGTWLIQIALNEARMKKRRQWRIPMLSLSDDKDKDDAKAYVPKDFEDWREIPSTALERAEEREALIEALGS